MPDQPPPHRLVIHAGGQRRVHVVRRPHGATRHVALHGRAAAWSATRCEGGAPLQSVGRPRQVGPVPCAHPQPRTACALWSSPLPHALPFSPTVRPRVQAALEDADQAVALKPSWGKGHGRRGAALQGLKVREPSRRRQRPNMRPRPRVRVQRLSCFACLAPRLICALVVGGAGLEAGGGRIPRGFAARAGEHPASARA
eukprot:5451990-Prymnesium_polylepis.1